MIDQKYIVITVHGEEMIFQFPNIVSHYHMFDAVKGIKEGLPLHWTRPYMKAEIVSAGFISSTGFCYGKSESLDVMSRTVIDTQLLWHRGVS